MLATLSITKWAHEASDLQDSTGIPCFLEVHFTPLHFCERPTVVPVFTNQKKLEKDFCF